MASLAAGLHCFYSLTRTTALRGRGHGLHKGKGARMRRQALYDAVAAMRHLRFRAADDIFRWRSEAPRAPGKCRATAIIPSRSSDIMRLGYER